MLHLILGTAGAGKTTLLHERIEACVGAGGKAILLVPEQSSFESEKSLCRRLGAHGALSVEVLSFTRLCDRVFREYGGLAGTHLDDTAKYLLMSVALGEVAPVLAAYGKNAGSAAFVASICETVGELKTAGVEPDTLRGIAGKSAERGFAGKLSDIALIFEAYQGMIERGYHDPDDDLKRACAKLEGTDFFNGREVFIDGFMAFMGAEWRLIERVLAGAPALTVALTCDGLRDETGAGVFSAVGETANRLIRLAKQAGSRVAKPVLLTEAKRFRNPALAWIASEFPKTVQEPCGFEAQGVTLTACEDVYDELEYAASQIVRLVRDEGCRYRDIVLIARSLDRYLVPLQTVFERYGIPFFTDLRGDIQVYPLVSGLLAALDAVRSNFDSEYVLALAKNCISGIGELEAGLLENYCFVWGIKGSAWTEDFVNNPDGMVEGFTPEQQERLERLNALRERLTGPLLRFGRGLTDCDGRGFAEAAFRWLEAVGAADNLQESARGMEPDARKLFLETGAQVWDLLIATLDVFGGALAGVRFPPARLIDLLRMSTAAADIGHLPQTLDQVIVGTADRVRPNEPRAAFVIGLNEGMFPQWGSTGGLFSAVERERLKAQGVDLLRTPERHALFERYFVYFALTQASEKLWLTWPMRSTGGAGLAPSSAVAQVERLTGISPRGSAAGGPRVENARTAFDAMTRGWREPDAPTAALMQYFSETAPERMRELERCSGDPAYSLGDSGTARALFGGEMRVSPSRVERYYNCPFSYFCQVGLRLNPRRKAEFNPLESGSLIHLVLEQMVKRYGGRGLSGLADARLRAEISEIIETDLRAKIKDFDGMSERFKYLFRRLVGTLARLLKRLALEFEQSDFEPEAFELPIGLDEEVKPLELRTPDGARVIVEGVVDRVDVYRRGGLKYVRVVDYKSGRKSFSLSDICYGLNMQMLIYLFTICRDPREAAVPAGVLYMPARDSVVPAGRNDPDEAVRAEQIKRLKMNGLLLEDREVLSAMEPDLAGVFIPVKLKRDGGYDARSSLANLAQMGAIERKVEELLLGIAQSLYAGKIDALPVEGLSDYRPCDWCDYRSVCGHEDGGPSRRLCELDRAAALELLEQGGKTDG